MANFEEIIGHRQMIEHLKNAIQLDKVSHAYIFEGGKGMRQEDRCGSVCSRTSVRASERGHRCMWYL